MKPIHDRMPVIVEPDDWPLWLGEVEGDPTTLLPPRDDLELKTQFLVRGLEKVKTSAMWYALAHNMACFWRLIPA